MANYDDWNLHGYAQIIELDRLASLRDCYQELYMTSGGYDPIHAGHTSVIIETARIADDTKKHYGFHCPVVVIVNGDSFLSRKKGRPFQDIKTRCMNVAAIRGVTYVVPFESNDDTVCEPIRKLRPTLFTKGGDRVDEKTIPEWNICAEVGTRICTGVGLPKLWSSSDFLKQWEEHIRGSKMPW